LIVRGFTPRSERESQQSGLGNCLSKTQVCAKSIKTIYADRRLPNTGRLRGGVNRKVKLLTEAPADAQANFLKLREDYRHSVTESLVGIDKNIADLEAKSKTAKAKEKANIDAALPNIHALRDSVMTEYRSLELASAVTWDDSKARVDKAVDDLKKAIDKAD
jgi:hypothetical protein